MTVLSVCLFVAAGMLSAFAVVAWRKAMRLGAEVRKDAETILAAAEYERKEAMADRHGAEKLEAQATAARAEALRIEDNILRPRHVLNPETGEWRTLLASEQPDLTEVLATLPSDKCRECWGRGNTGRDTKSQKLRICTKCVKITPRA